MRKKQPSPKLLLLLDDDDGKQLWDIYDDDKVDWLSDAENAQLFFSSYVDAHRLYRRARRYALIRPRHGSFSSSWLPLMMP